MAFQRTEGMSIIQALAMTVAEIPVFLYTTFGQSAFSQLRLTPGLRKVLFATALGTVALALAAHQLKRRRRRKKLVAPEKAASKPAGMAAPNSSSPTPASAGPWEVQHPDDPGAAGDYSAENLYFQGMELFEEALQKWEQALTIRQRDHSSLSIPWDSSKEQELLPVNLPEESQKKEFAAKLESLLYRAYNLQEEFGSTLPADSMLLDLERTLMLPLTEESLRLRADDEEDSLTSEDSFFSAAELFDSLQIGEIPFPLSKPAAAYEEALELVKEGKVSCRTFRTQSRTAPSWKIGQHQILQYLKDMFDLDIVRYTTVPLLAEDILQLSRRRSEILLGYLGVETTPEMNGTLPSDIVPLEEFN
ncbi:hypothetical protein JD844_004635 [Phrynosoma platyrhinos]|uniref:Mitoguardin 2 n=1 Tax=Phrynosoma platyrhinos TaxID=52577 RepID=A0ABQ7SDM0_PHRPL|nr:hypothetical protein JD844_004635 [Phrynosoma platyrhinos]